MDSKKEAKKYLNKFFKQQYFTETDNEFKSLVRLINKAQNKKETLQASQDKRKLLLADGMPSFEYFKECRKKLNLSMRDVTAKTGISIATISRLEQGNEVFYSNVKNLYEFYNSNEA